MQSPTIPHDYEHPDSRVLNLIGSNPRVKEKLQNYYHQILMTHAVCGNIVYHHNKSSYIVCFIIYSLSGEELISYFQEALIK